MLLAALWRGLAEAGIDACALLLGEALLGVMTHEIIAK